MQDIPVSSENKTLESSIIEKNNQLLIQSRAFKERTQQSIATAMQSAQLSISESKEILLQKRQDIMNQTQQMIKNYAASCTQFIQSIPTLVFKSLTPDIQAHSLTCNPQNQSVITKFIYHFSLKIWLRQQLIIWGQINAKAAVYLTQLKANYILSLGNLGTRTICMALFSTLSCLALNAVTRPFFFGKLRNIVICFALNGIFWTPQFFNPFVGSGNNNQSYAIAKQKLIV